MFNIFIDESGNFDFSVQGTRYFILTAVSTTECASLYTDFFRLKHRIAAGGVNLEEFHATNDKQAIRDQMYGLLENHCTHACFSVDSVIVQKDKVEAATRDAPLFYAKLLRQLLGNVLRDRAIGDIEQVLVWAARIGTHKKRSLFEKTAKSYLAHGFDSPVPYEIFVHGSASHPMLQVADYCCWAIAKRWKDGELRPYEKIRRAIRTEYEPASL